MTKVEINQNNDLSQQKNEMFPVNLEKNMKLIIPSLLSEQLRNFNTDFGKNNKMEMERMNNIFNINQNGLGFVFFSRAFLPENYNYNRPPLINFPINLQAKNPIIFSNDLSMNKNRLIHNNNNVNSQRTKLFNNYDSGYRCTCTKTQCNRKYCEYFNSGNFCIDCNCRNCNNRPSANFYSNKHSIEYSSKDMKQKFVCTCTKSRCYKNYCECFRNNQKCSSLCRCVSCENRVNYECKRANSLYILKNNIFIEDIKQNKEKEFSIEIKIKNEDNYLSLCKKRRREENQNKEENDNEKRKKYYYSEGIDSLNEPLFDKNGKVILKNINLIYM